MPLRIGLVAGESSGDLLGAGLIREILALDPDAEFAGVGGPEMEAAGCETWHSNERLAVMGIGEVLSELIGLVRFRRQLRNRFLAWKPDIFVGIDSPDFNLGLEIMLRRRGVRTVHYVSPSLWAWRPRRIRKVKRAADLVLCLLPFETRPYDEHGIPARFVGHPLADRIPMETDRQAARRALGLGGEGPLVALMPGSRDSEVSALGDDFAAAANWLAGQESGIRFVAPMVRKDLAARFSVSMQRHAPDADICLLDGSSREAIAAADVVLVASGTATLEATLIKRPMVVAYRVSAFSRFILETFRLLTIDRFALPNLLADRDLVPEILQDEISGERLGREVLDLLAQPAIGDRLMRDFSGIHADLKQGADKCAAEAVLALAGGRLAG